jgi:hypothetical protein
MGKELVVNINSCLVDPATCHVQNYVIAVDRVFESLL